MLKIKLADNTTQEIDVTGDVVIDTSYHDGDVTVKGCTDENGCIKNLDSDSMGYNYLNNKKMDGFVGAVEVPIELLDEEVPNNFPRSSYIDEDEQEQQKLWRNYAKYNISNDETKALIFVGYVNKPSNNRVDVVRTDELRQWIQYFGIDGGEYSVEKEYNGDTIGILTKSDTLSLRSSDYMPPVEEEI